MRNNVVNYLQRQGRGTEQFKFFSERALDLRHCLRPIFANYRKSYDKSLEIYFS